MAERSREKIALIVFVVLMVLGLLVAAGYVIAGHSLNIAATHIDDLVGSMDDYTVFVYQGTLDRASDDDAMEVSGVEAPADSDGLLDGALPSGAAVPEPPAPIEPISVEDVAADYRDKGANVIVLPTDDLSLYATGRIVGSGDRRIGVFSIPEGTSDSEVRSMVSYFQLHDVDFVVAVASALDPVRSVEGIDVLVTTDRGDASSVGETLDGCYLVQAPAKDSVGVVMVAPSLVVSSKTIAP